MIASIQGIVAQRHADSLTILVGGVGIEVFATHAAREKAEENEVVLLYTRLIVREDLLALYGFAHESERDMFDILLKVSGIGPKLALLILNYMTPDNLRNAIVGERSEMLTRVPGIGKKMAQKIVIELKDKIPTGLDAVPMGGVDDNLNADVMDALIALGFSIIESQQALQSLPINAPKDMQERIRLCLQFLSPSR